MKRTAGTLLVGVCLAMALVPTGLGAPLALGLEPNATATQVSPSQLGFSAGASAEAEANTSSTGRIPIAFFQPGAGDLAGSSSAASPDPTAAVTAGVAATTLLGIALVAFFWGQMKSWILGSAALPLFSRIAGNKILDNDVRNRVNEAVAHNPGITIKQITEALGIGWGTAVYHLKRLEEERLIVSERHRQFRRYFRNGGGIVNDDKTAYSELKHPTTQRLAAELLQRPGVGQKELCAVVGISAPLAHKYLARLEAAHLLTKEREWKTVRYFPTPRLGELMAPATNPSEPRVELVAA